MNDEPRDDAPLSPSASAGSEGMPLRWIIAAFAVGLLLLGGYKGVQWLEANRDTLLRAPVEWSSSLAAVSLAAIAWRAPDLLMMTRPVAQGVAGGLCLWALVRGYQGWRVVRYQRGLRRTRPYRLSASALDPDPAGLFLGRGFLWTARHTQRLWDATRAANRRFVEAARPASSAPPESGLPALHGVGLLEGEGRIVLPRAERQGHVFYVGTTGVGKTRALELAARQDIRNGHPVICMDPKGDPALFRCLHGEAQRAKRPFYFFHLGYPEHSARYNPIGRFSRLTEVATRIANQLPAQGNAEAFRQFAWLFTHMVGQALFALGERPDYRKTLQHMSNIDPLLVRMTSRLAALRRKVDAGWVDSLVPSLNLSWTLSSAARIWRAADVGASSNRPNSKTSWRSMSTNERNSPLSPLLGLADADVTVP